jgi:hypothetical protein
LPGLTTIARSNSARARAPSPARRAADARVSSSGRVNFGSTGRPSPPTACAAAVRVDALGSGDSGPAETEPAAATSASDDAAEGGVAEAATDATAGADEGPGTATDGDDAPGADGGARADADAPTAAIDEGTGARFDSEAAAPALVTALTSLGDEPRNANATLAATTAAAAAGNTQARVAGGAGAGGRTVATVERDGAGAAPLPAEGSTATGAAKRLTSMSEPSLTSTSKAALEAPPTSIDGGGGGGAS